MLCSSISHVNESHMITPVQPLLTIAVPTFNRADSLRATLSSIRKGLSLLPDRQRLSTEILVANNASTDRTREVCADYKEVTYIEQSKNLGYDGNVRSLYRQASGTWMLFLSDDDIFEFATLPILIRLLEERPQLEVAFCNWYSNAHDGLKRSHLHGELLKHQGEFSFGEVCKLTPFYFLSSFVIRRLPVQENNLLRGTYATQMEIALQVLNKGSRCSVLKEFLVGRTEPTTELVGGVNEARNSWRIHLGFTNVRRKFERKFGVELSPVAELSSALSSWRYVRDNTKPLLTRLFTLLSSVFYGIAHTKPSKLWDLPNFIFKKYSRGKR